MTTATSWSSSTSRASSRPKGSRASWRRKSGATRRPRPGSMARPGRGCSARWKPAEPRRQRLEALPLPLAAAELAEQLALAAHQHQLELRPIGRLDLEANGGVIQDHGVDVEPLA